MTIKEEIQIEEYKRTFAEAYKQGFIDAMSMCKVEPLPKAINGVKIVDAIKWADKWLEDNPVSEMWDMIRTLRDATEWQGEPHMNLLVTEYPQDGEVNLIGRDKTEVVVMAYDTYKELTEPQTECKMPYEDCEDCETHLKAQYGNCNKCRWYGDKQVCGRCRSRNLYAPKDESQTTSTPYKVDTSSICKIEPQTDCPKSCPSIDICTKDDMDCPWKKG